MIPVDEARGRILAAARPVGSETVSVIDAAGRVLARDIIARVTQPPQDVSAMDGYAVRADDVAGLPARLRVIGAAPAGHLFEGEVGTGEAVRIFTGGFVPAGADTIVIQEDTDQGTPTVTVTAAPARGRHIRRQGLDFESGAPVITAPRRLTARDVGLAAAANVPWVEVHRRPVVALLATGDEIVQPGEPVGPGQIVSANTPGLKALVEADGAIALNLGVAADTLDDLAARASGGRSADILVTTGGASVGDHDLVQAALAPEGLAVDFWKIAMRPGKPLMFGRLGSTLVLGLPGNPVSAMVCAHLFLRPLIAALQGLPAAAPALETAVLGADMAENDRREDYVRATLAVDAEGRSVATPFPVQDSSMMSRLAAADCLIQRTPHAPAAVAGTPVRVLRLAGC